MKAKAPIQIEKLKKKAVANLHRYIKERDSDGGYFRCINCGKVKRVSEMQAGHYIAAGSSSALKFNPLNINGECIECNYFKKDNTFYRINMIEKYGLDTVEELESKAHEVMKWNREKLLKIINTYK